MSDQNNPMRLDFRESGMIPHPTGLYIRYFEYEQLRAESTEFKRCYEERTKDLYRVSASNQELREILVEKEAFINAQEEELNEKDAEISALKLRLGLGA